MSADNPYPLKFWPGNPGNPGKPATMQLSAFRENKTGTGKHQKNRETGGFSARKDYHPAARRGGRAT